MLNKKILNLAVAVSLSTAAMTVTATSASKLQSELTPLGGERAGNADGSIPAWGEAVVPYAKTLVGDIPTDVYGDEKPLYTITAQNMSQYADKLTPGSKALLEKYSDSYRLDVYPTHRTANSSNWINENTAKNVDSCKYAENGMALQGCFGGTPFPMPEQGIEVVWNYLMRIVPDQAIEYGFKNLVVAADGTRSLATQNINFMQFPYFYKESNAGQWLDDSKGRYLLQRFDTKAPAFKVGESLVIHDSVNMSSPRKAWQYLVGQRRVRRAPTVGYDTPDFVASGANYFDEVEGLFGAPDRYEWKIIGKKEMIVPYNNNKLVTTGEEEAYTGHHWNPDVTRWELHRVWEVEATVKDGKRHAVPKRRYYFDEDTWNMTQMDGYDAEGNLWRTTIVPTFYLPKLSMPYSKSVMVFNLEANTSSQVQALHDEEFYVVERKEDEFYTGEAVAADSIR